PEELRPFGTDNNSILQCIRNGKASLLTTIDLIKPFYFDFIVRPEHLKAARFFTICIDKVSICFGNPDIADSGITLKGQPVVGPGKRAFKVIGAVLGNAYAAVSANIGFYNDGRDSIFLTKSFCRQVKYT